VVANHWRPLNPVPLNLPSIQASRGRSTMLWQGHLRRITSHRLIESSAKACWSIRRTVQKVKTCLITFE
jgi:hypothetical protein